MKEVLKRKPKIIDLRKKKITPKTPVQIPVIEVTEAKPIPPVIVPFKGGTFPCIDCKALSAQEFGRCKDCDTQHRQLTAQLDARPRMSEPIRVSPNLTYRKEAIGGVIVTISTSEPLRL